ncbi:ClpP/crotonase-like domain-containing protein [Xylariales sp. PMI_506]|nr:ClpP/crotonase-like domain-containing protein [Xylariales sp. PMI_506]
MPLKSKILDPRVAPRAQMSTNVMESIKPIKGDEPEDVLFNSLYGLRTIELNRPKKLNSLNGSMIRKILPRLVEWEKSDMANVVVVKGAGDRALCAGGDVKALSDQNKTGEAGQQQSAEYFALEYKLDHLIATYQKPYISFMDGITMGGGVGLSIHAPFRIATERTVFAMPETTIGFFPDVGASFFLPRMPGAVGSYLALTSERLTGANVFYSGIATHYLHSTSLPKLESRLAELRFRDYDDIKTRLEAIEMTIEEYTTGLPPLDREPMLLAGNLRKAIDRCFKQDSVPAIIEALKKEEGSTKEWAEKTLATLHQRSPTSVHVAHRQMAVGKTWSIAETFQREHQIAAKFMKHPDFVEGVDKQLSKERLTPTWTPPSLEAVEPNTAKAFFEIDESGPQKLQLLVNRDYEDYPYAYVGIPTEAEIEAAVKGASKSRREISKDFVQKRKGRQGIKVIVDEVLARKTTVNEEGVAVWEQ